MIDTSVQLNNHNSYHATENYWCTLYGVQTQKYVTVSFAVYATSAQAAKNLVKLRFYTEEGDVISESSHMFAVDTIWDRVSVTSQVPTTAKNMQICFLSGSYWWAEPKAEGGEIATAYSTNTAGALTWMTANGIYTGTLTANQIILSSGENLSNKLVTLNADQISLTDYVENRTTKLTNKGVYTGEVIADQVKTGLLKSTNGLSEINLDNGRFSFGNGALTWNGSLLSAEGSFSAYSRNQKASLSGGAFSLFNGETPLAYFSIQASNLTGAYITIANDAKSFTFAKLMDKRLYQLYKIELPNTSSTDPTHVFQGTITAPTIEASNTITVPVMRIDRIKSRGTQIVTESSLWYSKDNSEIIKFGFDSKQTYMQYNVDSAAIGVDSGGPFYITTGRVKKYLT